jgi:hypothetical protein
MQAELRQAVGALYNTTHRNAVSSDKSDDTHSLRLCSCQFSFNRANRFLSPL